MMGDHPRGEQLMGRPLSVLRTGQPAFAVVLAWTVVEAGWGVATTPWPARAGVLAAFLLWLVCLLTPRDLTGAWLPGLVLAADLGLVGLAGYDVPAASAALVLLPAIGVGVIFGRPSMPLLVGGVVLTVTVPTLVRHGPTGLDLVRSVVTPLAAVGAGMIAVRTRELLTSRQSASARQSQQLEAVLDTVDVGLVVVDESGHPKRINRRQRQFVDLVYPDGPPQSTGVQGLVFGEDGRTPLTVAQLPTVRAMDGEEFDDLLVWCGSDPRTRRAASVSSRVVWDPEGRFGGAVLSYHDVTDLLRVVPDLDEDDGAAADDDDGAALGCSA